MQKFWAETPTPTIGFMALDLSDPDVLDQLADGVARGLRGVKLYPVRAQEWGVVDKLLPGPDYPMWTPGEAVAGPRALTEVGPGIEPARLEWLFDGDPRAAPGVTA